ncbi:MAG: DinB family protein, partial [Actinomycetota bacterium]
RLRHNDDDPDEVLAFFEGLRRANLHLWSRTPVEERGRVGIHAERGPESYELLFRMIAGHDRNHLAQARRTLAAV